MPTKLLISLATLALIGAMALPQLGCGNKPEAYDTGGGGDGEGHFVTWEEIRDSDGGITVTNPETGMTWTILGIRTDEADHSNAKQNAERVLINHTDIAGMVGLWEYNPPAILQAVRAANMLDKVRIVGFDENDVTLRAIAEGEIVGTVVQNPYEFGFRSVELLCAEVRGQDYDMPANRLLFLPVRVILADVTGLDSEKYIAADAFIPYKASLLAGTGPVPSYDRSAYDNTDPVTIHFVANGVHPFWDLAARGCDRGAGEFNAQVVFYAPPTGQVEEQKRHVESMITSGVDALSISPIDASGQVQMINDASRQMTVMTCDSDAPDSDRIFYVGTDNVLAGYEAGLLLAEACPQGGKVMLFVGKLSVLNAQERSQGVINALFGQ